MQTNSAFSFEALLNGDIVVGRCKWTESKPVLKIKSAHGFSA